MMKLAFWISRLVAAAMVLLVLGACDDTDLSSPNINSPPRTTISGGPRPFSKSTYLVDLKWFGEDSDGEVVSYEVAWDDTSDWYELTQTGSTFVMNSDSCCTFDTLETTAGADSVVERFFRFHTFFVRSRDNRGDFDPTPAHITFNSVTVAPSTRLTGGPLEDGTVTGQAVRFSWEGTDPDSPENRVVAYEYFHITNGELRRNFGFVPSREGGAGLSRKIWNALDWVRVSSDTTSVVLRNLLPTAGDPNNKRHYFFVRSVDEAGAVEQVPTLGTNYVQWGVVEEPTGFLTIRSNVMGSRISSASNPELGLVFEGTRIVFSWGADLRQYGGTVSGYNHAYDDFIWSPWNPVDTRFPATGTGFIPTRGRHTFFSRVRDDAGQIILARFPFEVFAGPDPDVSSVLHWSDFFIEGDPPFYPGPEHFMSFWADTLLGNFNLIDQFNPREDGNRVDPPIRRMSQASTMVITVDDFNGTGWPYVQLLHSSNRNPIWSYVDAGGNLLLLGFRPSWNFLPDNDYIINEESGVPEPDPCQPWSQPTSCGGRMVWYNPIVPNPIPHPIYEYCGVETTFLDNANDYLWSARSMQDTSLLPDLRVDSSRALFFRTGQGMSECEHYQFREDRGVVPLYQFCRMAEPRPTEVVNGSIIDLPNPCDDEGTPVGIYIPSDGKRGHVVYLGMPLFYFEPARTKKAVEYIMVGLFGESFQ